MALSSEGFTVICSWHSTLHVLPGQEGRGEGREHGEAQDRKERENGLKKGKLGQAALNHHGAESGRAGSFYLSSQDQAGARKRQGRADRKGEMRAVGDSFSHCLFRAVPLYVNVKSEPGPEVP